MCNAAGVCGVCRARERVAARETARATPRGSHRTAIALSWTERTATGTCVHTRRLWLSRGRECAQPQPRETLTVRSAPVTRMVTHGTDALESSMYGIGKRNFPTIVVRYTAYVDPEFPFPDPSASRAIHTDTRSIADVLMNDDAASRMYGTYANWNSNDSRSREVGN